MEIKEISLVEFLKLLANGSKPKAFIYEKGYYWLNESCDRYESQRDYFDYIEIKNLNNKIQVILESTPCEVAQDKDNRKPTLLTLLEMHASGDFPKKIKIHNCVYTWDDEEVDYSNGVTKFGNKISQGISDVMANGLKGLFDALKGLFW